MTATELKPLSSLLPWLTHKDTSKPSTTTISTDGEHALTVFQNVYIDKATYNHYQSSTAVTIKSLPGGQPFELQSLQLADCEEVRTNENPQKLVEPKLVKFSVIASAL